MNRSEPSPALSAVEENLRRPVLRVVAAWEQHQRYPVIDCVSEDEAQLVAEPALADLLDRRHTQLKSPTSPLSNHAILQPAYEASSQESSEDE